MKERGYIARELLPENATDEDVVSELQRLADQPHCPPSVREHVLGVLHEHAMEQRAANTQAAREVAQGSLHEIELARDEADPET